MIAAAIVGVLALGALAYVLLPLSRTSPQEGRTDPSDAAIRKGRALESILDMEADLAAGKLNQEDFELYRDVYAREALEAMRELDVAEQTSADTDLEAEIAAARARLR